MTIPVSSSAAQFRRRYRLAEQPVSFSLDGVRFEGRRGDTVLTAILSVQGKLRHTEFTGERARASASSAHVRIATS